MEAKRERISALLKANVPIKTIVAQEKCSRWLIYKVKDLLRSEQGLGRKKGSGGQNLKLTQAKLDEILAQIKANPQISMVDLGKATGVSRTSAIKACKTLGFKSYRRRKRQLLSQKTRATRVLKGKRILSWLKKHPRTVKVFSDEKWWVVDQARNSQNDRWLAEGPEDVPPINTTKHPAGIMMLGVVTSDGKAMPPYWYPKGLGIGQKAYLHVMKTVVKPWLDEQYPDGNYVWQQDSAPGHKAKTTQNWCSKHLAAFWPWSMWPPSSPDCSPLDYGI